MKKQQSKKVSQVKPKPSKRRRSRTEQAEKEAADLLTIGSDIMGAGLDVVSTVVNVAEDVVMGVRNVAVSALNTGYDTFDYARSWTPWG